MPELLLEFLACALLAAFLLALWPFAKPHLCQLWHRLFKRGQHGFARRTHLDVEVVQHHSRRKPDWVLREVLRLKALMGKHVGCRKIADTFNRLNAPMSIGKTFVAESIKNHQYLLMTIARDIRSKKPLAVPINSTWAMDMSFITDANGTTHPFIGILDHGSRVCTRLATLLNKRSWTLLGHLCLAIGKYGSKPKAIRADNEACFNSFVFRTFLMLVGIRKQTIPVAAPWMNGRIERFFGTIKPWLKELVIPSITTLQQALLETQNFYNHVRTHQNLNSLTPAEIWQGLTPTDIKQTPPKSVTLVQALDGVLVGYHLRR